MTVSCGTACFVVRGDGAFLLMQRGTGAGRLTWSVPGGRVEPGESWRTTMARKVRQETGLIIPGPRLVAVTTAGSWVSVWGKARWRGDTPHVTDEAVDLAWVTLPEALEYQLWALHWGPLLAELGREGLMLELEGA